MMSKTTKEKFYKRQRYLTLFSVLAFLALFHAGSQVELPEEQAQMMIKQLRSQIQDIDGFGIFLHNMLIAAMMFIPIGGTLVGAGSALSTGFVFSAMSLENAALTQIPSIAMFITPFGMMELISYGIAMATSILWLRVLFTKERKQQLKKALGNTMRGLAIVTPILLVAGMIEFYMIQNFSDPTMVGLI